MNTREIAAEYRLSQWAQAMQERVAKGESIKEFCQRKEISRNTYFYWQRRLREAACQELVLAERQTVVPSGWAAVCEREKEDAGAAGAVSIEIGKCRVTATADTDSELLAKVCRTLVSIC